MAWLLAHMWIALALAALAGFLIGWALRDRHQAEASADPHSRSTAEFTRLQSENATLNAHLLAAKETADAAAGANADAEVKIAMLQAELDDTRGVLEGLKRELQGTQSAAMAASAAPTTSDKMYIDDIVLIGGIGDGTARKMKDLGITQIAQIAEMNDDELAELESRLGLISGRTNREAWREQAQDLMDGKPPRAKVDLARWEKLLAQGKGKPVL